MTDTHNPQDLAQRVQQALEYKTKIDELIQRQTEERKQQLLPVIAQLNTWLMMVNLLSKNIVAFESRPDAPMEIRKLTVQNQGLQTQLATESSDDAKKQIQSQIDANQAQITNIQSIMEKMKTVHDKINEALGFFEKVYNELVAYEKNG